MSPPLPDHRRTTGRAHSQRPEDATDREDQSSCPPPQKAKEHCDEPPRHQTCHRHSSEKAVDREDDDKEGYLDADATRMVLINEGKDGDFTSTYRS